MLEPCINQAAGLQAMAPLASPKLVAVASHGQQQGELPLLWSLCQAWVELGLPVLVLDGNKSETDSNPGLIHLLQDPLWHANDEQDASAWRVLPAALGFAQLSGTGFHAGSVGHLFRSNGVVLLYANATTLTHLLKNSGLTPLLVLPPLRSASMSAYQAMKVLVQDAQLQPTVANIALQTSTPIHMPSPVQTLQHCALTFLGLEIKPITVSALGNPQTSQDDISRLALQLLENAVPLQRQQPQRTH